jgi:hypothetical protein
MDAPQLQDRISKGNGRAALHIGTPCDLIRPQGPLNPLSREFRILCLNAAFLPIGGRTKRPVPEQDPLWEGIFDAAYTKPGDILRRHNDGALFYVAAQQPMLPVQCVRAQRIVTLLRPAQPAAAGLNLYGGTITADDTILAQGWPASIVTADGPGSGLANIEAEVNPGTWQVLLPPSLYLQLSTNDQITDDQGRRGIISMIETTDLGTRLTARQTST